MDLQNITQNICQVALTAGQFLKKELTEFKTESIERKGFNDFVSYVDKTSEKMIVEKLQKILPEAGFIAEEGTNSTQGERYNWIIDPLDGTTNFIHGVPLFCVSIGLADGDDIISGVVLEVNQDECFSAWKNGGAYLNNKAIHVSKTPKLEESLLATGFPYYEFDRMPQYLDLFGYFMQHTRGIRRLGSAAADLAYVACGRYDGFYEYSLKPWDVAGGAIIVKEAGGLVTDFSGGKNWLYGQELVSGNYNLFQEFLTQIKIHFNK